MLGPTADDVERKDDTCSTADGSPYLLAPGRAHHAGAARAGGDRRLRRPARRHRARRLPDPRRRTATPAWAGSARPGLTARWRSPSTFATSSTSRLALRPRDGLPELRMPNIGEAFARPYARAGAHRRRSRLRAHRLLLRAGHAGRDPRRRREPDPARRPRRAAPAHPRATWGAARASSAGAAGLPSDCWPGRRGEHLTRSPSATSRSSAADRPGWPRPRAAPPRAARVLVLEREAEPGGIPRHARHQGFGLRDLRRAMTRPGVRAPLRRAGAGRGSRAGGRDAGHRLGRGRARWS